MNCDLYDRFQVVQKRWLALPDSRRSLAAAGVIGSLSGAALYRDAVSLDWVIGVLSEQVSQEEAKIAGATVEADE